MNIEVTQTKNQAEQALEAQFQRLINNLGATKIDAARQAGMAAFVAAGLPNRRVEAWKYTDLRRHMKMAFDPAEDTLEISKPGLENLARGFGELDAHHLVLANGVLIEELSDKAAMGDVDVMSLPQVIENPPAWLPSDFFENSNDEGDSVIAINQALMSGGVLLNIKASAAKPILIIHLAGEQSSEPASINDRNLIRVGKDADATVIDLFVSLNEGAIQHNCLTHVRVEEGATLHHLKYQGQNKASTHLSNWMVQLDAKATYNGFQFSSGCELARNQALVKFEGEHSTAAISGATMLAGEQHCDTTLVIDHKVPNCASNELFKLVLNEQSRGVFQGKVIVRPDAQKTDGRQMCQALLLSERAEFDAKPELKIYADDVQCAHGATTGEIDEEMLFYLMARGIPEDTARALLTTAFVAEAFDEIDDEAIRAQFLNLAENWLGTASEASNG